VSGHVLVVSGSYDEGFTYRIECPTQPPTALMSCATWGDLCGCNERLSAIEDDDEREKAHDDLYGEPCPTSPVGRHATFEGEWWQPISECWPSMMLTAYDDEPARELGITEPGRYAVDWEAEDGESLVLDLPDAAVTP
jgi:hypothetical protein